MVFLIPEFANGKEKYFIAYDDAKKDAPDYKDHVSVEDDYFIYEPIPGQKLETNYYRINEDGYIIFGVSQKGKLIQDKISQVVVKFKPKTKVFESFNIDQFASFPMLYHTDKNWEKYFGSSFSTDISKKILIDGNLMVRVQIESIDPDGEIKTNNIYTYYFNPTEEKRIFTNVNHEVLKQIEASADKILDGSIANILSFKARSANIKSFNIGDILPFIHVYQENGIIGSYPVPENPLCVEKEMVLGTYDDVDLGSKAWFTMDNPKTGKAYGMIFSSTDNIFNFEDNGIQVKSYAKEEVKLPGLEVDSAVIYGLRNSYETGGIHDIIIKEGLTVNVDVEFIVVENKGYEFVNKESDIFHKLIKSRPNPRINTINQDEEEIDTYDISVFVHNAPSFPFGSQLSVFRGRNLSYITADLYNQDNLISSGSVVRIPLEEIDSRILSMPTLKKLISIIQSFEWENSTLIKKIEIKDLIPDNYLIKIYKENSLFTKNRQYIGFATVNITEDKKIDIYCSLQGTIELNVLNQNMNGVKDCIFELEYNGIKIAEAITDNKGKAIVNAPCSLKNKYTLNMFYNDILIDSEELRIAYINRLKPIKRNYELNTYNLKLNILDEWGFVPEFELNPRLLFEQNSYLPKKINNGEFLFENILEGNYQLSIKYKSIQIEKQINIDDNQIIDIDFPIQNKLILETKNIIGQNIENIKIRIIRNSKEEQISIQEKSKGEILLPPAKYEIICINQDNEIISKQSFLVYTDKKIDIITQEGSIIQNILLFIGAIVTLIGTLYFIKTQKFRHSLRIIIIGLLIISLFSSWWLLSAEQNDISTETSVYINPNQIISFTKTQDTIGGEILTIPLIAVNVLQFISYSLIFVMLLVFSSIFLKNKLQMFITIISLISMVIIICIFIYAMSLITSVGVGNFFGSGDINLNIVGQNQTVNVFAKWGPSFGFYLLVFCLVLSLINMMIKFHPKFNYQ